MISKQHIGLSSFIPLKNEKSPLKLRLCPPKDFESPGTKKMDCYHKTSMKNKSITQVKQAPITRIRIKVAVIFEASNDLRIFLPTFIFTLAT